MARLGKPGSATEWSAAQAGLMAIHLLTDLALTRWPRRREAIAQAFASSEKALGQDGLAGQYAEHFEQYARTNDSGSIGAASSFISMMYENALGCLAEIETTKGTTKRTRQGSFYTPDALVYHLVECTVGKRRSKAMPKICDSACGTGNFLVLAGSALGESRSAWQSLYGVDIDLAAVLICRWRIWIASGCDPLVWKHVCRAICVGDSLGGPPPALEGTALRAWQRQAPKGSKGGHDWRRTPALLRGKAWRGFDIMLGNPPFLSQLSTSTTHDAARQKWLKYRYAGLVAPYTDAAAIFLAHAIEHLAPGGQLGLVLPSSVLATRDCGEVRKYAAERMAIRSVWVNGAKAFYGVNVLTCAVVAERQDLEGSRAERITVFAGPEREIGETIRMSRRELAGLPSWSIFTRTLSGLPAIHVSRKRTLGSIAAATADFRDQYYGLRGHIAEWRDGMEGTHAPLVTSGLIDMGRCAWGSRSTRILKAVWNAPAANMESLRRETTLGAWMESRRVPKVLLATQTRVLEPWVDVSGSTLPCVPVITIVPRDAGDEEMLWVIGGVLASPVVSALARMETGGAALSAEAIKLSAKQCLDLPLPDRKWWKGIAAGFMSISAGDAAAEDVKKFGLGVMEAFGVKGVERERVMKWWFDAAIRSRFGVEGVVGVIGGGKKGEMKRGGGKP